VRITLTNGSQTTLQATVTADAAGNFVTVLAIPTHARSGSYQLAARSFATGQVTTATLGIIHLTPSIVVSPASTTPGSQVTVQGFGWALGAHVTLSIGGQAIGQATSGANGTFAVKVTDTEYPLKPNAYDHRFQWRRPQGVRCRGGQSADHDALLLRLAVHRTPRTAGDAGRRRDACPAKL